MRRQILLAALGLVALAWVGAAAAVLSAGSVAPGTGRDSGAATRTAPSSDDATESTSRAAQIQADLNMTRFMSTPDGPWAPMTQGPIPNPQLERARDPFYLLELEAAQRDINRMLAVTP